MQGVSKSYKWILVSVFIMSLISFAGFASSSFLQQSTTTELIDINNSEHSSLVVVDFNHAIPTQEGHSLIFSTFDFNHFLNICNIACGVKIKTQNLAVDNSVNCAPARMLVFIYHVNSDNSDNIFIG